MSTSCVVCKGSSQCQRCQIKDLKKVIEKQEYELQYLRKGSNKQLKLSKDYSQQFEIDNKFLPINYYGEMTDYKFLTITFDPNRFGIFNQPKDEQNYIFRRLHQSINDQIITQLSGCFEYQKNGTTHAHIIIKSDHTNKKIEDYFRPHFTDDPKNKYAIKSYLLQKSKCEDYLQKESTEYYRYDNSFEVIPLEEEVHLALKRENLPLETLFNIISEIRKSHNLAEKQAVTKLLKRYCLSEQLNYDQIMEKFTLHGSESRRAQVGGPN